MDFMAAVDTFIAEAEAWCRLDPTNKGGLVPTLWLRAGLVILVRFLHHAGSRLFRSVHVHRIKGMCLPCPCPDSTSEDGATRCVLCSDLDAAERAGGDRKTITKFGSQQIVLAYAHLFRSEGKDIPEARTNSPVLLAAPTALLDRVNRIALKNGPEAIKTLLDPSIEGQLWRIEAKNSRGKVAVGLTEEVGEMPALILQATPLEDALVLDPTEKRVALARSAIRKITASKKGDIKAA